MFRLIAYIGKCKVHGTLFMVAHFELAKVQLWLPNILILIVIISKRYETVSKRLRLTEPMDKLKNLCIGFSLVVPLL